MSDYRATIGLEIHAELKTRTKMFCSCANDADEHTPNKNICPVCMAHPGTLPVINREAVHKVLLVGAALGGTLADYTEFDRKSYFYPDIPKGYQISQYKRPLVSGGTLEGVAITRIHLEEDTARSQHSSDPDAGVGAGKSLVDYNRGGVPLMELVTEPVIHDAETAGRFARELQLLLRYLGAGEANMEKGELRIEANVSVAQSTETNKKSALEVLGTKVEVKNLNSFRSVEKAIQYETKRQIELIESGGTIVQETRGWDETKQVTFSQRKKEGSADYRYFPDPDLPKLLLSEIPEFATEQLKQEISGKLPWEKRKRYIDLGLKSEDAEMFVRDTVVGVFFDAAAKSLKEQKLVLLAANYIANDMAGEKLDNKDSAVSLFASLVRMNGEGKLSSRATKDILPYVLRGADPEQIAKEKGLIQQHDENAMTVIAQKVIDANPAVVADYKAGKEAAMQFLIGQGMKESKGSANPGALRQKITTLLSN